LSVNAWLPTAFGLAHTHTRNLPLSNPILAGMVTSVDRW